MTAIRRLGIVNRGEPAMRVLTAVAELNCAVNVDNAAHELYLRLGFVDHGVRARYIQLTPTRPADRKGA